MHVTLFASLVAHYGFLLGSWEIFRACCTGFSSGRRRTLPNSHYTLLSLYVSLHAVVLASRCKSSFGIFQDYIILNASNETFIVLLVVQMYICIEKYTCY